MMCFKCPLVVVTLLLLAEGGWANHLFIPMDAGGQANHLRAYGVVFAAMQQGVSVDWLLNYRGGSYGLEVNKDIELLCRQRGVSFATISEKEYARIIKKVTSPSFDGQVVKLEHAPKIAVYTPLNKEPWDDAVTLALTYAGIPFDKIYAAEVLSGDLDKYDWLHLHHEDFTGQYGKFWSVYKNTTWYTNDQKTMEGLASRLGFAKVSQMQLAVVKKIRDFVVEGGNLFAMCTATETFDIALAADGVDICAEPFDGDPIDPDAQKKLDYSSCLAFKDFTLSVNPYEYRRADIDNSTIRHVPPDLDYFQIVSPPGKLDAVPVMLTQNHTRNISGFMGQTTAFRKQVLKPNVMILGDRVQTGAAVNSKATPLKYDYYLQDYEAKYIHGELGKGSWTFLGGHDPEDYQHQVGAEPTQLDNYPNSPGYRLILNNVLFPSVKKTDVATVVISKTVQKQDQPSAEKTPAKPHTITIHPNPTDEELVITLSDGNITEIAILNIAGQEIKKQYFNAAQVNIGMKTLLPGMYMVKVNGEYAGKVVKD